jgi:chlorite dismutase
VRTPEWYLLDPERRRSLLIEHGRMGRDYPDVRANTVSAFGLGDYEWLLAFEADDVGRIVDLIRHLRAAEARLYTKNELPFITGLRRPLAEILAELP